MLRFLYNANGLSWYPKVTFGLCLGYHISWRFLKNYFFIFMFHRSPASILAIFPGLAKQYYALYTRLYCSTWIHTSESMSPVPEWVVELKMPALSLYSIWRLSLESCGIITWYVLIIFEFISDFWVLTFIYFTNFLLIISVYLAEEKLHQYKPAICSGNVFF